MGEMDHGRGMSAAIEMHPLPPPMDGVGCETDPHVQGPGRTVRCHPGCGVHRTAERPSLDARRLSISPLSLFFPFPPNILPKAASSLGVDAGAQEQRSGTGRAEMRDGRT